MPLGYFANKYGRSLCLPGFTAWIPAALIALFFLALPHKRALAFQQPEPANRYVITQYDLSDGLPTKTMTAVTFGEDGYLYLGSARGLIRMDGFHVDVFSAGARSGLLSDRILKIFNAGKNALIIGDESGNVYRFHRETADLLRNPATGEPIVTSIIKETDPGTFFLLDRKAGYLADDSGVRTVGPSLADYRIWDGEYVDSTIYVLNTDGLYVRESSGYRKLPMPPAYKPDLSYFTRMDLVGGHLRIYGKQVSACYDPRQKHWCEIHSFALADPEEEILHIKPYADGRYLVSTTGGYYLQQANRLEPAFESGGGLPDAGLFESDMGQVVAGEDGVWVDGQKVFTPEVTVEDADMDAEGTLWISTAQSGVYNIRENPFYNISTDFLSNSYAVARDRAGDFWAGSFYNGLARWNEHELRYFTREGGELPSNVNRMIAPLRSGGMLVSGWGAPPVIIRDNAITPMDGFWPLFGTRTNVTDAFYEDTDGTWWLGTLEGLHQKRGDRYNTFYDNQGKTLSGVNRIVASPFSGDLLFCTSSEGLVLLRNNRFYHLSSELPASSRHVRDAYVSTPDTVWAASYNGGLQRYIIPEDAAATRVRELGEDQGVEQAGYHRILADSTGYLWISSDSGLLRVSEAGLNQSADAGRLSTNLYWYREEDGLLDREFNGGSQSTGFYDEQTHHIWLTNQSGLVSFDPYAFNRSGPGEAEIRIQEVASTQARHPVHHADRLELESSERNLTLRYAHLSLTGNLTDQVWVRTSRGDTWEKPSRAGFLNLEDLGPGETTVYFSMEMGGPVLARFDLAVKPYFYETRAFKMIGLLILAAFIYLFYAKWRKPAGAGSSAPVAHDTAADTQADSKAGEEPIRQFIDRNFSNSNLNMHLIAEKLDTSRSSLYRDWKERHDISIQDYITRKRLEHARLLLREERRSVTEAALKSGFSSQSYFSKVYRKKYGETPSEYAGGDNGT